MNQITMNAPMLSSNVAVACALNNLAIVEAKQNAFQDSMCKLTTALKVLKEVDECITSADIKTHSSHYSEKYIKDISMKDGSSTTVSVIEISLNFNDSAAAITCTKESTSMQSLTMIYIDTSDLYSCSYDQIDILSAIIIHNMGIASLLRSQQISDFNLVQAKHLACQKIFGLALEILDTTIVEGTFGRLKALSVSFHVYASLIHVSRLLNDIEAVRAIDDMVEDAKTEAFELSSLFSMLLGSMIVKQMAPAA